METDREGLDLLRLVPRRVRLRDVTLRDGLQSERELLGLESKVSLVKAIRASGIREMEVTAFVDPKRVPAMGDAEELWAALAGLPNTLCSALIFNRKGLDRALRCGANRIAVFVSASEAHSLSNTGMGISEALKEALEVLARAKASGMQVRVGVAGAFGCNMEGDVPASRVRMLVEALAPVDPEEATLADTSGHGHPGQIIERLAICREVMGNRRLSLHLHDAGGWAFANLLAGLQAGVETFDVAIGGLGGCPFLPGAAGNLPAERVVRFLSAMGVETGVDENALREARRTLERSLGRNLAR